MNQKSKTVNSCQISGIKDLKSILSLGYLPPVNKLKKINSLLSEDIFFPSELVFSPSSNLVQINTVVNKEILFPSEYPYTSSTTKILRENFKELYKDCKKIINISSSLRFFKVSSEQK